MKTQIETDATAYSMWNMNLSLIVFVHLCFIPFLPGLYSVRGLESII